MTLEELKLKMKEINNSYSNDEEACHIKLDDLLIDYINDGEVRELFLIEPKYYA